MKINLPKRLFNDSQTQGSTMTTVVKKPLLFLIQLLILLLILNSAVASKPQTIKQIAQSYRIELIKLEAHANVALERGRTNRAIKDLIKYRASLILEKIDQLSSSSNTQEQEALIQQIKQDIDRAKGVDSWSGKSHKNRQNNKASTTKTATTANTMSMPIAEDLLPTIDADSDDTEIIALAQSLNNNPVEIFNYIRENVKFTPSSGSILGAKGTLQSLVGNATDTASLMIATMRAAGIPARYVQATVELDASRLKKWLGGVDDINQVLSLFNQAGINYTTTTQGGVISTVQFQHTWVEVWVDMHPSSGVRNIHPQSWVALDASYKLTDFIATENLSQSLGNLASNINQQLNQAISYDPMTGNTQLLDINLITDVNDTLENQLLQTLGQPLPSMAQVFGQSQKQVLNNKLLPASLPFKTIGTLNKVSSLSSSDRHQLEINVYATLEDANSNTALINYSQPLASIATQNLHIRTIPATAQDAQLLADIFADNTDINTLPQEFFAGNINVIVELSDEDGSLIQSYAVPLGSQLYTELAHVDNQQQASIQRFIITAGESRTISWNLQGGMHKRVTQINQLIDSLDTQTQSALQFNQAFLTAANIVYLAAVEIYDSWLAAINQVVYYQAPSFVSSYAWIDSETYFNVPTNIKLKGIATTAQLNRYLAYRNSDGQQAITSFNYQSNRIASHLSSFLLAHVYSGTQINASKLLVDALNNQQAIVHINESNQSELENLSLDDAMLTNLQAQITRSYDLSINRQIQNIEDYQGIGILSDTQQLQATEATAYGSTTNVNSTHTGAVLNNYAAVLFYQDISNTLVDAWVIPSQSSSGILQGLNELITDPLAITLTPGLIDIIVPTLVNIISPALDQPILINDYWSLSVLPVIEINSLIDPIAPEVNLIADPIQIQLGESTTITASATDNEGIAEFSLSIDGQSIRTDANNQYVFTPDRGGQFSIIAIAQDTAGNISQKQLTLIVTDPNDTQIPDIDILSPADGDTATGSVNIRIRVQDTNLAAWQLSYRDANDPVGTAPRTLLAQGTTPVNDAIVTTWDTSTLRNGIYVLVLEAIDSNGYSNNIANSLFIEGDLKIGNFQIAFEDLNIPVAGIPVTITRSYDTRNRNSDEAFGKGWEIGYQSLQLTESRIPGLGWYMSTEFYNFGPVRLPRYCIESIGDRLVSVRMPDDTLEKFKVKAKTLNTASDGRINCQDITPPDAFTIEFIPQGDTNSTLKAEGDTSNYVVRNGNIEPLADQTMYDPNKYTLTLLDGTIYSIDQGFNLTGIETTDGNSIKFTYNGIEHNNGYAVQFIRDSQDRIRYIQKPNGDRIEYSYDANGDLISHTDLNGNTTQFTYILDHYLEDIIDPRGITVARNEYDADGRLIAHIDANGNRIEYTHDIAGRSETIKDRNGNASVFVYDNQGSVIAETNPLGETTYHEYNEYRLETKRIDPLGNETTWTYDQAGNQLTETDALGNTTSSTYNRKGEILTQTDALGNVIINNEYNADYNPQLPSNPQHGYGQLKKVTDALGNTTEFHWLSGITNPSPSGRSVTVNTGFTDAKGNRYDVSPISGGTNSGLSGATTDLNGLKTESTYDDEARPLTQSQIITDANGNEIARYTTTMVYNENGDVIQTIDALGNSTFTEYNALNKISAIIDEFGERTEFEYDTLGRTVKTIYADGTSEITGFDNVGNEISKTDRAGRVTKTIYDAANRATQVIMPDDTPNDDSDNPRITNTYDQGGRLTLVTDVNGNSTNYEFDAKANNTKVIDALGNITLYSYDANSQRTSSTDALGNTTKFTYDLRGNLTQTLLPDSTLNDDSDNPRMSAVYDERNRKVSETDLAGNVTRFIYDAGGKLIELIDPIGQSTTYGYDQLGNKTSQTDANGHITSWAYNELSQVISHTLPEGQSESFTYDAKGNVKTHTDFNGDTTSNQYNVINQLINATYADGGVETFTYYPSGQTASITTSQGTTSYIYDAQDRIITETKYNGDVLNYTYDLVGNKTQTNITKGALIKSWDYEYDELNRLTKVTDDQNRSYIIQYNAIGQREKITQDNGVYVTYNYDEQNRLISQSTFNSTNLLLNSYTYTLSQTGLRENIAENSGRNSAYVYDGLYRLTNETITDVSNGNQTALYQYDPVGNRTASTINGVSTVYTYNANDQVLTAGAISYQYNANGSITQENDNGTISDYSYNKKNELIQLTTGADTYQYQYDPHGVRNKAIINGQTTDYLIDHNQTYAQVLVETTATAQTIYTYGDDLLAEENSTGIHYYQYDGLGSTRQLTDASQTVTDKYNYDAYGVLLNQTGSTQNNYLYTGEQYDPNMGFYYLRARYMNPQLGRFTSMDTFAGSASTPISLNKYVYANTNPITYTDPSGNFSLAEFSAVQRIRGILNNNTINIGFNFLDPANAEENVKNDLILGAAAVGGAAAFKLFRFFSSKFRKACNSFADNTMVSTEFGFKDISEINIGDKVWAFNEQDKTITLQEVVHTIKGQTLKQTIDITLASGEVIQATDGHPIYAQSEGLWDWVEAKDLKQDMLFMEKGGQTLSILNITHNSKKVQVYNLTVANGHTYYVTKDEVLVHNAGVCRSIRSIDTKHILHGDFNNKGRFGGWHSRYIGNPSGRRINKVTRQRNSNGVYEAVVQYKAKTGKWKKKKTNGGKSTFFPDDWSPSKIEAEIQSAYIQAIKNGKGGVKITERSSSGVLIEMILKKDGGDALKVRSAFPIYE